MLLEGRVQIAVPVPNLLHHIYEAPDSFGRLIEAANAKHQEEPKAMYCKVKARLARKDGEGSIYMLFANRD